MILAFYLSMPSNNAWNGRWTGEGGLYARTRTFRKDPELSKDYYHYSFGDGWAAAVEVKKIDSREAARLRRKSVGFCGYDWMIDSILRNDKIIAPSQEGTHGIAY